VMDFGSHSSTSNHHINEPITATSPTSPSEISIVSEQTLDTIFQELLKRKDYMEAIEMNKYLLDDIALNPAFVSVEQAIKDFRREQVLLNDVPFIPDSVYPPYFSLALQLLVERLIRLNGNFSGNSRDISDLILQRACRTSSGADSFFKVQSMFRVDGSIVVQRSSSKHPPIVVDVFLVQNSLCSRIVSRNMYALYKEEQFDNIIGDEVQRPSAWLFIDTVIVDHSNFQTMEHKRVLSIKVYDPRPRSTNGVSEKPRPTSASRLFLPKWSFQSRP